MLGQVFFYEFKPPPTQVQLSSSLIITFSRPGCMGWAGRRMDFRIVG
jgi:hypothetical protein